jgi:hypothetical protein
MLSLAIGLILSVCIITLIILARAKPNIFIFQLIERVFGRPLYGKRRRKM